MYLNEFNSVAVKEFKSKPSGVFVPVISFSAKTLDFKDFLVSSICVSIPAISFCRNCFPLILIKRPLQYILCFLSSPELRTLLNATFRSALFRSKSTSACFNVSTSSASSSTRHCLVRSSSKFIDVADKKHPTTKRTEGVRFH